MGPQATRAIASRGPPSLGCGPNAKAIVARPSKAARTPTNFDRLPLTAPVIRKGETLSPTSLATGWTVPNVPAQHISLEDDPGETPTSQA
jgi:hypothetical protein